MKVTDLRQRKENKVIHRVRDIQSLKDTSTDHLRWNHRRQKGNAVKEGLLIYDNQGGGQDHTFQSLVNYNNKRL